MINGSSIPDPFLLESRQGAIIWRQTDGRTLRSQSINPALKTLVLVAAGQSNAMNIAPTTVVPSNYTAIDNFNIYDGACYDIPGALLGCTEAINLGYGVGHIAPRIADKFVTAGVFDRVVIVSVAIGNTGAADWATGGVLADRLPCTMRRLASRGFIPGTAGLTFGTVWMQGENDTLNGTSQASMTASLNSTFSNYFAAGYSGRIFVTQQSWDLSVTSAAVRAAQASTWNGTTIFDGGDLDTLNDTKRQDTVHFNDSGMSDAATIIYNKMRASGAPF